MNQWQESSSAMATQAAHLCVMITEKIFFDTRGFPNGHLYFI